MPNHKKIIGWKDVSSVALDPQEKKGSIALQPIFEGDSENTSATPVYLNKSWNNYCQWWIKDDLLKH